MALVLIFLFFCMTPGFWKMNGRSLSSYSLHQVIIWTGNISMVCWHFSSCLCAMSDFAMQHFFCLLADLLKCEMRNGVCFDRIKILNCIRRNIFQYLKKMTKWFRLVTLSLIYFISIWVNTVQFFSVWHKDTLPKILPLPQNHLQQRVTLRTSRHWGISAGIPPLFPSIPSLGHASQGFAAVLPTGWAWSCSTQSLQDWWHLTISFRRTAGFSLCGICIRILDTLESEVKLKWQGNVDC